MGMNQLEVREDHMALAELEFQSLSMLFDKMMVGCKAKCIPPRYGEEELNKGETACIDRCTAKYFKTNLMVGQYMRENNQGPATMASAQLAHTSFS